nr:putative reverse transcriptase domain-containing protein [Tanacetum cinerariifolium]
MEILLEPTSNKLMVVFFINRWDSNLLVHSYRVVCFDEPILRSILTDLQVTPTKPGRMTKPYSSHRFIANGFNVGNLKIEDAPFEALYGRKCHSPLYWTEVRGAQILGPELIQETIEKIVQIKQGMQAARDRQKSYADLKHKPMEFQVRDKVMIKVSPWKGVVRFGKRGKLNPRYVGPFKILKRIGDVAYKLDLPEELSRVHNMLHVSNLKKSLPLDGLHLDDKFHFVEKLVEIVDREVKRLKQSRIPLVKVRWNSKRGPEFT